MANKWKRFWLRLTDAFYHAFGLGACFGFGAMIASDRPIRSAAAMMACIIITAALAQIFNILEKCC